MVIFSKDIERVAAFYLAVLPARVVERDTTHIVLASDADELVVHGISKRAAKEVRVEDPPVPRSAAAIKPVFTVDDLDRVRTAAAEAGGMLYPSRRGFHVRGALLMDGVDPEGNVVQFRQTMPPPEPLAAGRSAATRAR